MKIRPSFTSHRRWHTQTDLNAWLTERTKCRVAMTLTFGTGRGSTATSPSERTVQEILRKGIRRLNSLCYRNLVKRKGYSIGAVSVIEGTGPFTRIHAHVAFEPPPAMPLQQFEGLADRAFKRSKWIEQRPHITECWSEDWISYMLKLGQEALVPSCCFTPKHPGA